MVARTLSSNRSRATIDYALVRAAGMQRRSKSIESSAMLGGADITLRPSPAHVTGATVAALAIGGLGFVMFYFGGIRSGAPVPLVLGLVALVLAAWLESQMFGFIRLRDGKLTAFSVVFGRKVVPVSDITALVPRDFTTQRRRHLWTFRYTRHTLEVHTTAGGSGILLDPDGFGKENVEALVAALGLRPR